MDISFVSTISIISGTVGGVGMGVLFLFLLGRQRNAAPVATHQYTTSFVFSGNLKQTALLEAVQFLEMGKRQGILHIYCGRRKGYLTFCQGEVIDAFYRDTTGKEAIFSMLEIEEGDFYFEPKIIDQPRVIAETIMDIVVEYDSRRNEQAPAQ